MHTLTHSELTLIARGQARVYRGRLIPVMRGAEDLGNFYPTSQTPSPNGGGMPSAPGTPGNASSTTTKNSPALYVLAFVGAGFLLLHFAG